MSYEKRGMRSSSPTTHDQKSSGISRSAVQPFQKASMDQPNEAPAFLQRYDGSAFSLPVARVKNHSEIPATTPFQLKGIIQLEGMEIGSKEFRSGSYRDIEKLIGKDFKFNDDEKLIIEQWILQENVFKDIEDFRRELNLLLQNWEKQKIFYPTQKAVKAAQAVNSTVTMYSARGAADIDALYLWAVSNPGIELAGFAEYIETRNPARVEVEAPFQGHFGDKVHTRKHFKQKSTAGAAGVIGIELNEEGSRYINTMRNPVAKEVVIPKGGGKAKKGAKAKKAASPKIAVPKKKAAEGKTAGEIGFKSEHNFVSAAVGGAKATWKLLMPMIRKITLLQYTGARKEEKKSDEAVGAVPVVKGPEQVAREATSARIFDHLSRSIPIRHNPRAAPANAEDRVAMAAAQGIGSKSTVEKAEVKKGTKYKGKDYGDRNNWLIRDYGAGGDCLFLSLNGSNNVEAATSTRQRIVNFQRENDSIGQGVVDNDFADMLGSSPHDEFRNLSQNAQNREEIPIEAYYDLMASQGTWGGRSEIEAYSDILNNNIYVIEEAGDITCYQDGAFMAVDSIPNSAFRDNSIILYKTQNHWERVIGKAR